MNWHYAVGGQQQGPVDDAQLDALIQAGTVTPDTLVWREGMANWQPLRQARPSGAAATALGVPPVAAPMVAGGTPGTGEIVCAECGKIFTKDNAIQYGAAWVCASCKPVFLQKLREGAAPSGSPGGQPGAPFDPDAFLAAIRQRDYTIDIGSCLGRAWELVKSNFWISVGVVVLTYVCLIAGSAIPCVGGIVQLVIQGPLMGGMFWFFLRLLRGQEATVGDVFSGFSTGFLQLFLAGLVSGILVVLAALPGGLLVFVGISMQSDLTPFIIGIGALVAIIPALFLNVCWIFGLPLVMDKKVDFWPALELSRKVVSMHWLNVFLLLLVCFLLVIAGFLALCLGVLVAAPVVIAAIAYAYEDIFSSGTTSNG